MKARAFMLFMCYSGAKFSLNASKNFAPAFPAWCTTPEKIRIDCCLNCKKTVKKSRFFAITHLRCANKSLSRLIQQALINATRAVTDIFRHRP